jgi:hypothetical protein
VLAIKAVNYRSTLPARRLQLSRLYDFWSIMNLSESVLAARVTDGEYPLHVALERSASSELVAIKLLLELHDLIAIILRNNAGETPLHVACRCVVPFEIVRSFVDHDPSRLFRIATSHHGFECLRRDIFVLSAINHSASFPGHDFSYATFE